MTDRGVKQFSDVFATRVLVPSIEPIAAATPRNVPFDKVAIERPIGNHDYNLSKSSLKLEEAFRKTGRNLGWQAPQRDRNTLSMLPRRRAEV
jgi:hypothetical protein